MAGLLCDQWDLPAGLRDAVAGHHHPEATEVPPAVRLVAPLREIEHQADVDAIIATAAGDFGIAPERSAELFEEAKTQAVEVAAMFT